MNSGKNQVESEFLQLETQPEVFLDKLFNLMRRAHEHGILFIVFDECENEFDHREIHNLSKADQVQLYKIARDEIARHWHRNDWVEIKSATGRLQ